MSRFRLHPTPAQQAVLRDHCGHARYIWNLAVEQHAHWHPGRKGAPGYLEQCLAAHRRPAKQPHGQRLGLAGREPHADQDAERDDECDDARAVGQVAAKVGAGREKAAVAATYPMVCANTI